jgi:hypothetical protein
MAIYGETTAPTAPFGMTAATTSTPVAMSPMGGQGGFHQGQDYRMPTGIGSIYNTAARQNILNNTPTGGWTGQGDARQQLQQDFYNQYRPQEAGFQPPQGLLNLAAQGAERNYGGYMHSLRGQMPAYANAQEFGQAGVNNAMTTNSHLGNNWWR